MTRGSTERGIALLLAISVLAALGVVSLTGLTLARAQRAAGLGALARVHARGAAGSALAVAVQGWSSALTPTGVGQEVVLATVQGPGPAFARASVRALGGPVYEIRALGVRLSQAGDTLGAARLSLLVQLGVPDSNSSIHPVVFPRGWRSLP